MRERESFGALERARFEKRNCGMQMAGKVWPGKKIWEKKESDCLTANLPKTPFRRRCSSYVLASCGRLII